MTSSSLPPCHKGRRHGFTLVELLVVVGVIVLMMTLAVPAFNSIRGGTDFTSVAYDMSGLLDQARSYAMANNTFVLVGIMEVNSSQGTNANPQVSGTGRIAVAVIASKDGTRPYQALLDNSHNGISPNLLSAGTSITGSGAAFTAVTKLYTFSNVHIVDLQTTTPQMPTSGNMLRPAVAPYYDIGNTVQCVSATPFGWPLGTGINGSPVPQYSFGAKAGQGVVIEFDPQGSARIITTQGNNGPLLDAIPQQIELAFQPARGTVVTQLTNETSGQMVAIQIDGMSGAVQIYRP
jgi:prepilin-type N-terminal cleavage/methylation domain-containing protein